MGKVKSENKSFIGFKAKKRRNKWKTGSPLALKVSADPTGQEYCCPECPYKTDCAGRLNAHQVCHSTRRPFACEYADCGQTFKRQNSLQRHVKALHLKERLFACRICEKKFSQSQSLNDHLFIHLDDKSFRCQVKGCTKVFQTPKYLKSHQSRRHPEVTHPTSHETAAEAKHITEGLEAMKTKAMEQLKESMVAQEKSSLSTNTKIANLSPVEAFQCFLPDCDYSCRLWRSLRSHYKYEHSELYDPKTKTIGGHSLTATDCRRQQTTECNDETGEKLIVIETSYGSDHKLTVNSDSDSHNQDSNDGTDSQDSSDRLTIDKISANTYFYECNYTKCHYRTKSFDRIADHFCGHWQPKPI